jgi:arylsulfatase A-like enzyme
MAAGQVPAVDLIDQEREYREHADEEYWRTYGAGRSNLPEKWHSTTWIGERALAALAGWNQNGGHLLHASFIKPHHPFDPPAPWDERYDPDALTPLPGWTDAVPGADEPYRQGYFRNNTLTEPVLRRVMAHYYATISQLDEWIGRLLAELRSRGLYDDTMIIFTSDHGEYLGFHHLLLKFGPLYDPVVKVPLLIKYPGRPSASVDTRLVSLVDIAPTVLSICDSAPVAPLPGLDLSDPAARRDYVFTETHPEGSAYMVRSATHKLLTGKHEAFFDLTADPLEFDNHIADPAQAQAIAPLRDALAQWIRRDIKAPDPADQQARRDFFADRMQ